MYVVVAGMQGKRDQAMGGNSSSGDDLCVYF